MGRGLSDQQRRVLSAAYASYRNRAEEYQQEHENRAWFEKIGALGARMRGKPAPPPLHGPTVPPPHITHDRAMIALHGWRSGRQDRDWWARRRHNPSDTMVVSTRYGGTYGKERIATIVRAEYETAHASTARTLARLVGRGMLEPHPRRGWYLTEAGVRWCAAWVDEEEVA